MIAQDATLVVVEAELVGAKAWAGRNEYGFRWNPQALELRVTLRHRRSKEVFFLFGGMEKYPVLPPIWTFAAEDGAGREELHYFPRTQGAAPGGAWLFINHNNRGIICAPFNRLSYGETGPHSNWGDAARWREVEPAKVHAHEIGPMLAVVDRDLQYTDGRMG